MIRYIMAITAVMFLSSCGLFPKNIDELACPEIGFIPNSDIVHVKDIKVSMDGFSGSCRYEEGKGVHVEVIIPFIAEKSPDAGANKKNHLPGFDEISEADLPYFIAVLRPDETILKKTVFSTKLDFYNLRETPGREEHDILIPLHSLREAYNYKITMGFILTPEQLKQNKESK